MSEAVVAHLPVHAFAAAVHALPIVLDTALKGGLLVALGGAATTLMRARSAAQRHATWAGTVVAHLALPVLTLAVPGVRVPGLPLLPAPPWLTADPTPLGHRDGRPSALAVAAALWLAGVVVVVLRLAVGTVALRRLARASLPVVDRPWVDLARQVAYSLAITRPVALRRGAPRQGAALSVPITWGVRVPVVLLPADADAWPEEQRRLVLVHELAHVRRYDTLTQLLAQCAVALFWFDPLLWLAAWRLRVERERACDDAVLRDGAAPSRYAAALLAFARSLAADAAQGRAVASPAVAALAMASPAASGAARRSAFGASEFAARVHAILDPARDRVGLARRTVVAGVGALVLVTPPLAALRPFRAPLRAPPTSAAGRSAASGAIRTPPPLSTGRMRE